MSRSLKKNFYLETESFFFNMFIKMHVESFTKSNCLDVQSYPVRHLLS